MKVAIRADASPEIGSGHVMRCLCLAGTLVGRGAEVRFLSRQLPAHLAAAITAAGHGIEALEIEPPPTLAPQQAWPAAYQALDARASVSALAGFGAEWLVADHYGLDRHWESAMRRHAARLFAIDDLAREHDCDLLLDQALHADPARRYAALVPRAATLLLGPAYALLRPEFRQARAGARVRTGSVQRLLVFMGGMDAGNATSRVLEAVSLLPPPTPGLDIVIGPAHPARAAIEQFCRSRPHARCHVQTGDMAALLAGADLAVGAGGGASWERCCLGVPTLALAVADNQRPLLASAARAGLVYVPDGVLPDPAALAVHLQALLANGALREAMSAAGMALVDGRGAGRVAAAMLGALIRVRRAREDDCDAVHGWRNAAAVRAQSRQPEPIALAEHRRWFEQVLESPHRALLIGEDGQGAVGVVRFDIEGAEAEVSIYLAEPRLGQGLGGGLLAAAEQWLLSARPEVTAIRAEALAGNAASERLFRQAGYRLDTQRFCKRIRT